MAKQVMEASGWEQPSRYLIRDRDGAYDEVLSADVDQWAFATRRHRHAPHGKTAILKG
jgi:hypothetical protein